MWWWSLMAGGRWLCCRGFGGIHLWPCGCGLVRRCRPACCGNIIERHQRWGRGETRVAGVNATAILMQIQVQEDLLRNSCACTWKEEGSRIEIALVEKKRKKECQMLKLKDGERGWNKVLLNYYQHPGSQVRVTQVRGWTRRLKVMKMW